MCLYAFLRQQKQRSLSLKTIIFITVIFCFQSFAEESAADRATPGGTCPNINLTQDPSPNCMRGFHVRNQRTMGTCFAQGASQVIDCMRVNRGGSRNHETSAVVLAAQANFDSSNRTRTVNNGRSCNAFSKAQNASTCNKSVVDDRINANYGGSDPLATFYSDLQGIYNSYRGTINISTRLNLASDLQCRKLTRAGMQQSQIPSLVQLVRALNSNTELGFFNALFERLCQGATESVPFGISCQNKGWDHLRDNFHNMVQSKLRQGLPVEFGYCSMTLYSKHWLQLNPDWRHRSNEWKRTNCRGHGSLIVGVRQHNGQCQYLVRNSWGTSCNRYYPGGNQNLGWECNGGDLWISAENLKQSSFNIAEVDYN